MQIQDLLIRPGTTPQEAAPAAIRVKELLPGSAISIGPPAAEDRVEISALTNVVLQANEHLAGAEEDRVERLRASYARGGWIADPERLASRMVEAMAGEGRQQQGKGALDGVLE